MDDLATYYLKQPNVNRERAGVLMQYANNMPQDPYGFSSIAKIPAMALAGKEMRQASETDESNRALAIEEIQRKQAMTEKMAESKQFFEQFVALMKNPETKAAAVQFWNTDASKYIPNAQPITDVFKDQKVTGVKFENGLMMGVMETPKGNMPVIFDEEKQAWKVMQPGDAALMVNQPGTPEGRRIYGELQDTSMVPTTPVQDPNNPDVTRPMRDIYTGAMEKNLATEAPDLHKTYMDNKQKAGTAAQQAIPNTDFELFYNAGIKAGKSPDQISREWEDRKVRIARESRPPKAGGDGTAKTGEYDAVDEIIARLFLPTAREDAERGGIGLVDPETGKVSRDREYEVLHPQNKAIWDNVQTAAQKYVASMSPSAAVQKALKEVRGGATTQTPIAPTIKPKAQGKAAKKATEQTTKEKVAYAKRPDGKTVAVYLDANGKPTGKEKLVEITGDKVRFLE